MPPWVPPSGSPRSRRRRSRRGPAETEPILIVHPNAVLSGPIALKRLEPVAGWHSEVVEASGDLELPQLATCDRLDTREPLHPRPPASFSVSASLNETIIRNSNATRHNVKREYEVTTNRVQSPRARTADFCSLQTSTRTPVAHDQTTPTCSDSSLPATGSAIFVAWKGQQREGLLHTADYLLVTHDGTFRARLRSSRR